MVGVETALIIGAVTSVASTAYGAYSSYQQSQYQAEVAKMNAKTEQANAKRAIEAGLAEAEAQDRVNARVYGEQLNAQAGSGLSTRSGSFALGRKSARSLGRLDTMNVAQAGYLQAYNHNVAASQYKAEASAAKAAGRGALIGGALGVAGGLADAYTTPVPGSQLTLGQSLFSSTTPAAVPRFAGPRSYSYKL